MTTPSLSMYSRPADRDPVIVAAARTAVGRAKRGSLSTTRPDEMAVAVIRDLLRRASVLNPSEIDDVILGCAFPEGEQGMNMARLVSLRAGLPESVPAETINRFCSSGLQSIAHGAHAIMAGQAASCDRRGNRIDEHGSDDRSEVFPYAIAGPGSPALFHQYGLNR